MDIVILILATIIFLITFLFLIALMKTNHIDDDEEAEWIKDYLKRHDKDENIDK